MEYYSAIKRNEFMVFASKWMKPNKQVSEISQSPKPKAK